MLTPEERDALNTALVARGNVTGAVERIVAARESAAAEQARAEVVAAVETVLVERAYAYRDAPRSSPVVESVAVEIRDALHEVTP